jgi:membrane fusion protein (multidrug efflux system)
MLKKFIIALLGFAALVGTLGAVKVAQIKVASAPRANPPTGVATTEARALDWHPFLKAIGTLAPVEGVMISADADGTIVKIAVESGATVKAGDLLIEIDTTVEAAQLAATEARRELTRINLERAKELSESKAMAKSEYDAADAAHKQAVADVAALQALIEKKRVRAPFDGRVGIRQVNLGQYISRGRALLPLQKLNPIYVNFSLPQRDIQRIGLGQKVAVTVDAFGGQSFTGTITAINSEVDGSTRNIAVQATLPNADEKLRAGMFAQVEAELPTVERQIVVPATAIAYASYGNSVYVVEKMKDADGKEFLGVRQQFVKLGPTRGDLIAITEGLKVGEKIVTGGVFKLRNAMPVEEQNAAQPASSVNPKPANT